MRRLIGCQPFDVGDRLRIDKDEFIVQKMNLLTTTLRSDDNSLRVVVNQQLANSPLTNLSRTSSAIVIVSVQVGTLQVGCGVLL